MKKIRRANAVIDTSGTIEQTQKQVDGLLESVAASAAPVRRPPSPTDAPSLPDDVPKDRPAAPRRAVRVAPIETEDSPRRVGRSSRARSAVSNGLPTPVRFLALALALILLVTGAVSITKTYLAKQEERRRLEAEAAERAQHPLYYGDLITLYASEQNLDPALVSRRHPSRVEFRSKGRKPSRRARARAAQSMPDTAEWIAHKYSEDGAGYSFDSLDTTRKPTSVTARGTLVISPGVSAATQRKSSAPTMQGKATWTAR